MRAHIIVDTGTLGGKLAEIAVDRRRLSRLFVATMDGVAAVAVDAWQAVRGGMGYAEAVDAVAAAASGSGGGIRRAARLVDSSSSEPISVMSAIGIVAELAGDIGASDSAGVEEICAWLEGQ